MAASPHLPLSNNNIEDDHHHHHHHHHHSRSHSHLLLLHHHHQQQKHDHHENSADSSTSSDSSSDDSSENPNSSPLENHLSLSSIAHPPFSSSMTPPPANVTSNTITSVTAISSSGSSAIATGIPVVASSANSPTTATATGNNITPNSSTAIIPVNSSASNSAPIATAIPLLQFHPNQQQRLLSLHLSSSSSSPPPSSSTVKTILALPIEATPLNLQNPAVVSSTPDRHSRDDCWSEGATLTLINAWGDRYLELNRGNLKQKHWKEVAECVNTRCSFNGAIKTPKSDVQCKNRLDTLKKKYKLEKSKILTGGGPSKWTFFDQLDELIGTSVKKPLLKKLSPSSKLQSHSTQSPSSSSGAALRHIIPSSSSALPSTATGAAMPLLQSAIASVKRPFESDHESSIAEQKHLIQPKHEYVQSAQKLHPHPIQPANPNCSPNLNPSISANPNMNFNDRLNSNAKTNPSHGAMDTDILSRSKEHSADIAMADDISCHEADADNNADVPGASRLKRKRFCSTTPHTSAVNSNSPTIILANAIAKFGEVYERIEIAKHQQMMEMEKQRMEFTKELELQRLQLFMQTQVELAKLKHGGDNNNNKQACNNNTEHYL